MNWPPSACWIPWIVAVSDGAVDAAPMMANRISAIVKLGTVVQSMCRMWVKRSVPAIAGARFVVSDSGDILSPKYAPEITAPAASPMFSSCAVAMPIRATPTVPAVVQELPVASETKAQIAHAAAKKTLGVSRARP